MGYIPQWAANRKCSVCFPPFIVPESEHANTRINKLHKAVWLVGRSVCRVVTKGTTHSNCCMVKYDHWVENSLNFNEKMAVMGRRRCWLWNDVSIQLGRTNRATTVKVHNTTSRPFVYRLSELGENGSLWKKNKFRHTVSTVHKAGDAVCDNLHWTKFVFSTK